MGNYNLLEASEVDLQSKDLTDGGNVERFTKLDVGQDQDIYEEEDEDSGKNSEEHPDAENTDEEDPDAETPDA